MKLSIKNLKTNLPIIKKDLKVISLLALLSFSISSFLYDVAVVYFAGYYNVKVNSLELFKMICFQFSPVVSVLLCVLKFKSIQYKNVLQHHSYILLSFMIGYVIAYYIFSDEVGVNYSYYLSLSLVFVISSVGLFSLFTDFSRSKLYLKIKYGLSGL